MPWPWSREKPVVDPVCGRSLKADQVLSSQDTATGRVHFCSAECMSRYRFDPARYG